MKSRPIPSTIEAVNVYDAWNPFVSSTAEVTDTGQTRTWTYAYDGLSNLVRATSPEGRVERFEYDERGFAWRQTRGLGSTAQSSRVAHVDRNGRIVQVKDENNHTTTVTYDGFDREKTVTDAAGDKVENVYDDRDEIVERYVFDGSTKIHETHFVYDSSRRLTKAIEVDTSSAVADLETWFQYRRDSRLERRRSARGYFTDFEYDAARRLEKVIDSLGNEVSFELDPNGNREKVFSKEKVTGSPDEVYETRFVYDALDRVTEQRVLDRITPSVEQVSTYDYDLRYILTEVMDPLGREHRATYDLANRRISATETFTGLAIKTTYGWDNDDLLVKGVLATGRLV